MDLFPQYKIPKSFRLAPRVLIFLLLFFPLQGKAKEKSVSWSEKNFSSLFACDVSVAAKRGDSSVIRLTGIPNFHNQLEFEVVKSPLHGVIKSARALNDHTVEMVYLHDGTRSPLMDEFLFRVKSVGRSPSAPAICTITIKPPPAMLVFEPQRIEFSPTMIGSQAAKKIILKNIGGMEATGRLNLPTWIVAPEGDSFRLGEGDECSIPLQFAPFEEKGYERFVGTIPNYGNQGVQFSGQGIARFSIGETGLAQWEIKNLSPEQLTLETSGGEGWNFPRFLKLLPGESKPLMATPILKKSVNESEASDSILKLTDGFSPRSLKLPPPPKYVPISVSLSGTEHLGHVPIGASVELHIQLVNRAVFPRIIVWEVKCRNGGGVSGSKPLMLRPGELKNIPFTWNPTIPGDTSLNFLFYDSVSVDEVSLICKASIIPEHVAMKTPSSNTLTTAPVVSESNPDRKALQPVDGVDSLSWGVAKDWWGNPQLMLKWRSSGDVVKSVLNYQVLIPSGKALQPDRCMWRTLTECKPSLSEDGFWHSTHKGMTPGWHVLGLGLYGKDYDAPKAFSQFACRIPEADSLWKKLRRGAGWILLIVLILFWRKLKRLG